MNPQEQIFSHMEMFQCLDFDSRHFIGPDGRGFSFDEMVEHLCFRFSMDEKQAMIGLCLWLKREGSLAVEGDDEAYGILHQWLKDIELELGEEPTGLEAGPIKFTRT